jgi:hypothetical protein
MHMNYWSKSHMHEPKSIADSIRTCRNSRNARVYKGPGLELRTMAVKARTHSHSPMVHESYAPFSAHNKGRVLVNEIVAAL